MKNREKLSSDIDMKKTGIHLWTRQVISTLSFLLCMGSYIPIHAQSHGKVNITGKIYELNEKEKRTPLGYATLYFPDYGIGTTTDENGCYKLENVPTGKARLQVQYIGKLPIDTLVHVTRDLAFDFTLLNEDFKLKEVVVTATNSRAGKSTASNISRQAMDHLQATSLHDLLALMPGGISQNSDLSSSQQINIRQIASNSSGEQSLNALGTAIIRDGAPISNNSNLSAMNPTVSGGASALGGGASPNGGVDVRSISTENIESVEIIRGIPSVEYGDLTSGAMIVNTKAGREPLRVKAKANPNVYQVSMGTGYELGKDKGALNVSADYAYNTSDPKATYQHYQRATGKVMYSNAFFDHKLRSNTSFDFIYGKDTREKNPDDESTQTTSEGRDVGFRLNTNGTWSINKGWLQNIRYVLSGSYTDKQSFYETAYGAASAPYSMTTTDGAILSNFAGQHIFDAEGNQITNFGSEDAKNYAVFLPSSYIGHYEIDSREMNAFGKLTATLFRQSGKVNNRILLGADFKTDGNVGKGKTFDPTAPPLRSNSNKNSSYRPRTYKDIPFIHQFGLFAEENFTWSMGERDLRIQAGMRFDHASKVGSTWSPRFNASFDLIPRALTISGGYGITAKMPTLLYLYPEKAYFEYVNINELANESIPENERLFMTTTKVYDTENRNLKVAKNHKAEIGLRLNVGKVSASVTAFQERLKNGYSLDYTFDTFNTFIYNEYTRDANGDLILASNLPVLNSFYTPTNNLNVETQGLEFDINIGRMEAIRTAFQLNGAWMRTKSWSDNYHFYDNSGTAASSRKPVAIYEAGTNKNYRQQFTTTLRATHNLPQIGFVVTLTAQAVWNQANWKTFGNDTIPVGYISLDNEVTMFPEGKYTSTEQVKADGFDYLLQNPNHSQAIKESYNPYFCFNINVTKEISDMLRVSFFANNMFRSYPRMESKRNPGTYTQLNNRFFFGLELSLTL